MACFIVGDSIALGTAVGESTGGPGVPQCELHARIGASSAMIVGWSHDADLVVISAGSNDPDNVGLEGNLEAIRRPIKHRVLWIVPVAGRVANIVRSVALRHGDATVAFAPGRDGVHPHSYAPLVSAVHKARMEPTPR